MKLKYILMLFPLLLAVNLKGQELSKRLNVGDMLPDVEIAHILNGEKSVGRTSEYKDRLLILDFWSTHCPGCIEALPKMEILQKKYGSKVKIFPVTSESQEIIKPFFKSNKYTKGLKLPLIVGDELFKEYFPYQLIPHEVWIYKGKVIAITDDEYVNEEHINCILSGKQVKWPVKYDYYTFDRTKPLFATDSRQVDTVNTFIRYAAISDYRDSINYLWLSGGKGIERNKSHKTIRSWFLNQPIFNSYAFCLLHTEGEKKLRPLSIFQPNQIVWKVADRSRYKPDGVEPLPEWVIHNGICFESVVPDNGQDDQMVYRTMIKDMNRLLGLQVGWERRQEKVLILIKSGYSKTRLSKGTVYSTGIFTKEINEYEQNPYVFNETGSTDAEIHVDIKSWTDLGGIRKSLEGTGYQLKEEEREVDKLVFSETNGSRLVDLSGQAQALSRLADSKSMKPVTEEQNKNFMEDNRKRAGVKVTASGMQYRILRSGKGLRAKLGDNVLLQYEGSDINRKVFESIYTSGFPVNMKVGSSLKGINEALQLMSEGDKLEVYLPAELAYGSSRMEGKLLANSPVIYMLELIRVLP